MCTDSTAAALLPPGLVQCREMEMGARFCRLTSRHRRRKLLVIRRDLVVANKCQPSSKDQAHRTDTLHNLTATTLQYI